MNYRIFLGASLIAIAACSKTDAAPDGARVAGAPGASGTTEGGRGGANGASGAAGRSGGRGGATLTLATTDVATLQPTTIEDVTSISGDLHPIETVSVRSRIEGNLDVVNVREGEVVRPGQLLARFDASEQESALRSAEADLAAAQSDLTNAQWNADQSAKLFKAGAIAERDNLAAQQMVVSTKARLAAADARVKSASLGVRDTRVVAPTAGVVDKRQVENGEHVARGATMFSIVRNDVLELIAAMPARAAGAVRVGQAVRFTADGREFAGRVSRVSATIDPVTRAVTVYAEVPNQSGALRGGTFATGQVISRTIANVIAIPRDAIHQTQNSTAQFVYRIIDGAVDVASIKTGVADDRLGLVEVVDGLKAGDRIIVGNVSGVGRGMKVTVAGGDEGRSGSSGQGAGRSGRSGKGGRGRSGGTP